MFALSVLPPLLVVTPLVGFGWTWPLALTHAALCPAIAGLMVELLLFGFRSVPCGEPWRPERAGLRVMWPAYLAAFIVVTQGVPALTRAITGQPVASIVMVAVVFAAAVVLRRYSNTSVPVPADDEIDGVEVLNLN
jgi:hypothetical protein